MHNSRKHPLSFGFCYFPQITRVEDFYPFWVIDDWNEEGVRKDFNIMKALGCDCIRIHMTPPVPGAICYDRWNISDRRVVPITAEKYIRMLDFEVNLANEKGLNIHFDIGSTFDELTEQSVIGWVGRYKGKVESYQFANENYGCFKADRMRLKRLEQFCIMGKEIDPQARFTADLTFKELNIIRKDFPRLFQLINPVVTHGWFYTDGRGWTDDPLNQLIASHSGKTMPQRKELLPNFLDDSLYRYPGITNLGKPIWITEIAGASYGPFGGFVPESRQALDWQRVMESIYKSCPLVERVYHCWFSDKLHYFEYGRASFGVIAPDGKPKEIANKFLDSAGKYGTHGKQSLQSQNIPVIISSSGKNARLEWDLKNNTSGDITAFPIFITSPEIRISKQPRKLQISANGEKTLSVEIKIGKSALPTNHIFCALQTKYGTVELWGVVRCPRQITIHKEIKTLEGVYWRPSKNAVEKFLQKYGKDCAFVVGPGWDYIEIEMAFRLQTILESLVGFSLPLVAWYDFRQVWDRPLIVLGCPKRNFVSQILELSVPEDRQVKSLKEGEGQICLIEKPFGKKIEEIFNPDSPVQLVGLRQCPAVLYIAGADVEGTRRCGSDFVRHIKPVAPELLKPSSLPKWTLPIGKRSPWDM